MNKYIVRVLETGYVTPDVKRFKLEKPEGYHYIPGQATDVSINREGLQEEQRPFTFTSRTDWDHLEFIIKIYKGHNGVTEKLAGINAGEELIIHDVFGTITYQGPGLFIAGGAGITPFIAILRDLKNKNKLEGNSLLFANRSAEDIILKDELGSLLGDRLVNVLEQTGDASFIKGWINKDIIKQHLPGNEAWNYICGPDKFTAAMIENLHALGIDDSKIIIEK